MAPAREPVALLILRVRPEPEFDSAPLRVELVRIDDVMDRDEQPRSTTVADVDEALRRRARLADREDLPGDVTRTVTAA